MEVMKPWSAPAAAGGALRVSMSARGGARRGGVRGAREGVDPPAAVVDGLGRRLAELAIAGDVDADLRLLAHDVGHGGAQARRQRCVVEGPAGGARFAPRPVHLDEAFGPGQAPRVAGQYLALAAHVAPSHPQSESGLRARL